jgi:hypothetical protein
MIALNHRFKVETFASCIANNATRGTGDALGGRQQRLFESRLGRGHRDSNSGIAPLSSFSPEFHHQYLAKNPRLYQEELATTHSDDLPGRRQRALATGRSGSNPAIQSISAVRRQYSPGRIIGIV